jgi:hypothetical protein
LGELRLDELHSDSAPAVGPREIDPPHSSGAQPADEAVGTDVGRVIRAQFVHVRSLTRGKGYVEGDICA